MRTVVALALFVTPLAACHDLRLAPPRAAVEETAGALEADAIAAPDASSTSAAAAAGALEADAVAAPDASSTTTEAALAPGSPPSPAEAEAAARPETIETPAGDAHAGEVWEDGWRYASREEHDETDRILREIGALRRAEGMLPAPEPTADELDEEEAQLPWLEGYARTCWRFGRATSLRSRWRWAEEGARIARGVAPDWVEPGDGWDEITTIDADHPGHPLDHVRARMHVEVMYDDRLYATIAVGERELTTYPDGGIFSLYPDHPLVEALATYRDGDCVLVTGHVLGAYTNQHMSTTLPTMACGWSFWTRIDAIEPCGASAGETASTTD